MFKVLTTCRNNRTSQAKLDTGSLKRRLVSGGYNPPHCESHPVFESKIPSWIFRPMKQLRVWSSWRSLWVCKTISGTLTSHTPSSPPSKANWLKEPRGGIFKRDQNVIILHLWKQPTAPGFLSLYLFNGKNKEVFSTYDLKFRFLCKQRTVWIFLFNSASKTRAYWQISEHLLPDDNMWEFCCNCFTLLSICPEEWKSVPWKSHSPGLVQEARQYFREVTSWAKQLHKTIGRHCRNTFWVLTHRLLHR